jgi:hypothetical protein
MKVVQSRANSPNPNQPEVGEIVIETGGWTWGDAMVQVTCVALYPVGALFAVFLSGPQPPADVLPRLLGFALFVAGVDLFVEALISVRRVSLDSQGVSFRYLFHTERREWTDLEPSKLTPRHGGWGVISRFRGGHRAMQRAYALTIEQARAIVGHPNCPRWDLPADVRKALNLPPVVT